MLPALSLCRHLFPSPGVDQSCAQEPTQLWPRQVFELDRVAVARILAAAAERTKSGAEGGDMPQEACLDDLLQVDVCECVYI